jgi:hypothetical protein
MTFVVSKLGGPKTVSHLTSRQESPIHSLFFIVYLAEYCNLMITPFHNTQGMKGPQTRLPFLVPILPIFT